VTDFGLAREAEAVVDPHAVTGPISATPVGADELRDGDESSVSSRSTPLAGLTVTGSLLGTPAYMAPEQWRGGAVTPATDQFGFCVALWEALAGERPFRGPTVEALREEILRGPGALDASKIPRRMRRVLRRGLDPVPSRRWPSMNALLAAMTRAGRRSALAIALGVIAAAVVAAIVVHAVGRSSAPAPALAVCPAPALDPDAVWSDARRQQLVARRPAEVRVIDADFAAWRAARERACHGDAAAQLPRHACLDAVLVRLDAIARAVEGLAPGVPATDAGAYAIDPVVCEAARPPRLSAAASPQLREVIATSLREGASAVPYPPAEASALVHRASGEPCAAALARLLFAGASRVSAERDQQLSEAEQDAERCSDDRVRAEVALAAARHALTSGTLGAAISTKVKSAEVAVERVAQRDLTAGIDWLRLETARRADHLDEAIARGEAAVAGFAARGRVAAQLAAGVDLLELRDLRARADDVEVVPRLYAQWRALAVAQLGEGHPTVRRIDLELATRMFVHGDVEGAHARLEKLRRPLPNDRARHIRGRVLDGRGRPVEGATVVAASRLAGDSIGVAVAFPGGADEQRFATTNKAGAFELLDAPAAGVVIAQHGASRSMPAAIADTVTLALEPTSRLEGRIELNGEPVSRVLVSVQDLRVPVSLAYELVAPVAPDGSFAVEGVPRTQVRVFAALRHAWTRSFASATADVRAPVVRGVSIAVARSKRVVHVIVRSTVGVPVGNAQVYVFPEARVSTTALEVAKEFRSANVRLARQIEGEHAPAPVVGRARPGDMFATMNEVPKGATTACAIGLPPDLSDRELNRKLSENLTKIEVRCVPIASDADVVVVEVPPWPRLD
jgi:hypothetical protein